MPGIPCNAGLDKGRISHYNSLVYRGMAKFGIALGSGPRGLGFESRYSDHSFLYEQFGVTVVMIDDLFVFEKKL